MVFLPGIWRDPLSMLAGQDYCEERADNYLQASGSARKRRGRDANASKEMPVPAARDLDPGASPAHFFGAEVRHARTSAGMTLAELGALVPCDASTVSRIESGQLRPAERFAAACDEAFPNMNGWFTRFYADSRTWAGPYPKWFADWVNAERDAVTLRTWEPLLIPGLLQTAEYARALFRAWSATGEEDEVDQLVSARLDRQRIFDRSKPPSFWAVIDEGVIRRCIGSPKVMHGQLLHLAEMTERPMVRVHVIPSEVGAHTGLLGAFAIAGFADDAQGIVYFESPDEGETTRDSPTIAKMVLIFDTLRSEALPRGATRDLVLTVAEEYKRDVA